MKFLYSDTQDYVDPGYDFAMDRNAPGRRPYWDDMYAHEMMTPIPYDGLLVSMSAVRQAPGVAKSKVRYSTAEEHRMLRDGVRKFLRFDDKKYQGAMVMGDCGAFAYVEHNRPAFSPDEVVDFYADGRFTHGISPDHIIFQCEVGNPPPSQMDQSVLDRYDITLSNAEMFLELSKAEGAPYIPVGAVQGWSPRSIAQAAIRLEKMGYGYLAIGGLVPLKVDIIHLVLTELRKAIRPETKIHLLGFAKADQIQHFTGYGITSFDSTSPLIRAFKDEKANFYLPSPNGGLDYYAAVRIPQATENTRLVRGIKRGIFSTDDLIRREQKALTAVRQYDAGTGTSADALDAVTEYQQFLTLGEERPQKQLDSEMIKMRGLVHRTLTDMPWKQCKCDICRKIGVDVIIFRSANRNRRRGFHNLGVYHQHVQRILENPL